MAKINVTVGKCTIKCRNARVALHRFNEFCDGSGWNETGGGWRLIYNQLKTLLEYNAIDNKTYILAGEYQCYLKVAIDINQ